MACALNLRVDASARAAVEACDVRLAATYDAVATRYAGTFADELDEKQLERALLGMICESGAPHRGRHRASRSLGQRVCEPPLLSAGSQAPVMKGQDQ